jgi:hypothetical protein
MSIDRPIIAGREIDRETRTPEPVPAQGPNGDRHGNSSSPPPLDWTVASDAAAALLDESFGSPGTLGDPLMNDMVQELAARLCAYDEIVGAVDHMHARPDVGPRKR